MSHNLSYSTRCIRLSIQEASYRISWCADNFGNKDQLWTVRCHDRSRYQWWFTNQDDLVWFCLVWESWLSNKMC